MLKKLDSVINGFRLIEDLGTVSTKSGSRKRRRAVLECKYCNSEFQANVDDIKSGNTKSCGCMRNKFISTKKESHGDNKRGNRHPLYSIWSSIKARCNNPNSSGYFKYGAKGVTICKEWNDDYLAFKEWSIENGYKDGMQIDKDILSKKLNIDPPIYSPETCMWVNQIENSQSKNQHRSKKSKTGVYGIHESYIDKNGKKKYRGDVVLYGKRYRTKTFDSIEEAKRELDSLLNKGRSTINISLHFDVI